MERIRKTIGACFQERAAKSPGQTALESDEQSYTWRELDNLSNYMAARMAAHGVAAGTRAGIWSTNSPNWVIVFLALEKLGAVPVLLNTCYSAEELEQVLSYAEVEFVYYGEGYKRIIYADLVAALREKMSSQVKRWVYIGRNEKRQWMTEESFVYAERMKKSVSEVEARLKRVQPEDTAAILFTSGTTALPKGVMLSHYSLVNNSLETCEHMKWQEQDKMLIAVPLFHCFGVTASLLASIHTGFSMYVIEYYKTIKVLKTVQEHRCTLLNGVPSMFLAVIKNPERKNYDLSSLRRGIIAGSPVSEEEYEAIRSGIPGLVLHPSYGQTETSPCVSIADVEDTEADKARTAGRVIAGCETAIFDPETGRRLPCNETGEIRVRGYNVMQGYYNMPEETARTIDEDGWLHTGDLGRLDERGYLYVLDRMKEMIIRGGENISPREIEEVIKDYPGIRNVKVIGLPVEVLQEMVVACIVTESGTHISDQELLTYLERHVAYYKVPSYIVRMREFPVTASGKIVISELKEQAKQEILRIGEKQ